MKKLIPYCLLLCLVACSSSSINDKSKRNQNWCWWVDAGSNNGKWIPVNGDTTVQTGSYTLFYPTGVVFEKGRMADGKKVDTSFSYAPDGQLQLYSLYSSGKKVNYFIKDGFIRLYRNNNTIESEGMVENHLQNKKKWTFYYDNGNLKSVYNIVRDTSWQVRYYESGSIRDSGFFLETDTVYTTKTWYPNGNPKHFQGWKDKKINGPWINFYENGNKKDSCYMDKGVENGIAKTWYETGELEIEAGVMNNKANGVLKAYYQNGKLKILSMIKDRKVLSTVKFDKDGKVMK